MLTFHVDSTVVVLELHGPTRMRNAHIRTGAAWREASSACVVLVLKLSHVVTITHEHVVLYLCDY